MAASVTTNVHRLGVKQTVSYADKRRARAVRPVIVKGLANNAAATQEAIDAVKTALGTEYNNDATLPLSEIQVSRAGRDMAYGYGSFAHSQTSTPTDPAFDTARMVGGGGRTVLEGTIVEDETVVVVPHADGSGSTTLTSDALYYRRVFQPVARLVVRTVLDTNPEASFASLIGKINSDAFTINGIERAIHSLRCDTPTITPIPTPDGTRWVVEYYFAYKASLWVTRRFIEGKTPVAIPGYTFPWYETTWTTEDIADVADATFAGGFPVHA